MTFLPIAERELRVAARRKGTYRLRAYVTFIALVIAGWIYLVSSHLQPAQLSTTLFNGLATLAFIYCLLAGTRVTADCLSEEKREGTLGLLFLTDLNGYDIVLGKLAATSMNSLYGLLSLLPMLAIPLLMGGVSIVHFGNVVLVLLNTLFLSLATGIFVSSLCRHERKAIGGTFLLMAVFSAGVPGLGAALAEYVFKEWSEDLIAPFLLSSPIFAFSTAMIAGSMRMTGGPLRLFGWSLLVIHLLGWLLLLWTCRLAPRSWQDRPASLTKLRWKERWQRWCHGTGEVRLLLRHELLSINPFLWLAGRDRLMQSLIWAVLALLGVLFYWGYSEYPDEWLTAPTAISTAIILHTTLKLWVSSEASRRFIEERREGSLELLLCTPLTVREILLGQRLAMRRLFAKPLFFILAVDLLLLWMGLRDQMSPEERGQLTFAFIAGMAMLVADYFALIWVGMWQGLAAKNTKNAGATAMAYVLLLPWIVWLLLLTFYGLFVERTGLHLGIVYGILAWLVVGLAVDWIFAGWSFHQLHSQFRRVALQRLQPATKHRFWHIFR